jgi:hypothetical protein
MAWVPGAAASRRSARGYNIRKMPPVVALLLQAAAPQPNDWQKVGLALAGVVVGVLLEPLRVWIAGAMKRRQIRNLLYRDVARINACLDFASEQSYKALHEKKEIPYTVRYYLGEVSLDVYEHIFNTERTTFYHLPEALAFKQFYGFVEKHVLSLDEDADPADVIEACTESRSVLKEQTAAGEIDKDRVRATEKKYAKQQAKRTEKSLAYHNEKLKQFEAKLEAAKRKKATEA